MKKIVRKTMFVLSFLGLFTLLSCKKEKQFSCDPEIHIWAKENFERFQDITREQLATLPVPLAQAAYRTLTPEKKFEFWNEKLDIVYSQWDMPVREMMDDMRSHMSVSWFDPELGIMDKDYIKSWENTMLTEWMDSTNFFLNFCMIYTEEELDRLEYSSSNGECSWANVSSELMGKYRLSMAPPGGGEGLTACDCEWDSYCRRKERGSCNNPNCNRTLEGCGYAWLSPCTKTCDRVIK